MGDSINNRIDWQSIRQRVDAAFADIARKTKRTPTETQQILKARAKTLARAPASIASADAIEILEFQLGHEHYAVETCYIREAHPLDNLTTLPGVPDFVMGVMNIRGEILSIVDIKPFFGLPQKGIAQLNKVIVLELQGMAFGILADELAGVRRLPMSELEASRQGATIIDGDYIRGITASGLAILNGQALLTDKRMIIQ